MHFFRDLFHNFVAPLRVAQEIAKYFLSMYRAVSLVQKSMRELEL